jgi:hypothetical protein
LFKLFRVTGAAVSPLSGATGPGRGAPPSAPGQRITSRAARYKQVAYANSTVFEKQGVFPKKPSFFLFLSGFFQMQ